MERDHHYHPHHHHYWNKYRYMKKRNPYRRYVAGAFFVVIGAVLLLNNLGILALPAYVFTWEMLLIVMGLYMLLNVRIIAAAILMCIGLYFLLPELTGMEATTLKTLWPALLIIVGIGIVLKGFNRRWCEKKNSYVKTEDLPYMTSTVIFGSEKKKLSSHDFEGAKLTAIFGGIELDLTSCTLKNEKTLIDVTAVCGGIELSVPRDWNIKTDVVPIMGGIDDRINDFPNSNVNVANEVIIRGEIVMGGIEIRRV